MASRLLQIALTGLALWSAPAWALAEDELGLATVLASIPPAAPAVAPFTVIDAPITFGLGSEGRMTVLHLRSCERIEVEGGSLAIGFRGIETSGRVLARSGDRCPRPDIVATDGVLGGTLMRSGATGEPQSGRVRLTADGSALQIESPIEGTLLLLWQNDDGRLSRLHGPTPIRQQLRGALPAGKGRLLAIVAAASVPGCDNEAVRSVLTKGPAGDGLGDFRRALRAAEAQAPACGGPAVRLVAGDLLL